MFREMILKDLLDNPGCLLEKVIKVFRKMILECALDGPLQLLIKLTAQ